MNRSSQRGSAILFLFIAVALFGAIGYAFLQGSQTSTSMVTSEADKAAAYKSQDCSNAVNMAGKRLQARGCTMAQISTDGTGAVGSGPTDGSCAVYHPNGGGVKGACAPPAAPTDPCTTGPIGTVCTSDSAIYIGVSGGNRIYAKESDLSPSQMWKTSATDTPSTNSTTDGKLNTDAMIAAGAANHPAAQACRAFGAEWYIPSKDELHIFYENSTLPGATPGGPLDLPSIGINVSNNYWSSTQFDASGAWDIRLQFGGAQADTFKTNTIQTRCVRR